MRRFTSLEGSSFWRTPNRMMKGMLMGALALVSTSLSVFGQCPPDEPPLAPITEDFQSLANGGLATFANCWTSTPVSTGTSSLGWRIEDGPPVSTGTGPAVDNTLGTATGKYIYFETSAGSTGSAASFTTTDVSLDNLGANRVLSFYYHMYGATMGTMSVEVFDGFSWNQVWTISGQQHSSAAAPWTEAIISLNAYSGVIKVRFNGTRGTSFTGDMAVDDISIDNAALCPKPTSPTIANVTYNTADVSWTPGALAATAWEVEYGTPGFAPGTGAGTSVNATSNSLQLTGLTQTTSYSVFVREACVSVAGQSDWVNAGSFTTSCDPNTTSWFENFEAYPSGSTSLPLCWSRVSTVGNYYVTTTTPSSGVRSFYMNMASTGPLVGTVKPVSNLGAGTHRLRFYGRSGATTYDPLFEVGYVTNVTNASTFVSLASVALTGTSMVEYQLPVPAASIPTGAVMAFAFRSMAVGTATSGTLYLDDVNWEVIPACPLPTGVASTSITNSTATLSWTAAGTDYEIEYGPAGFTPGTGTVVNVTGGTTGTITGLTGSTAYTAYVRQDCGASGLSPNSNPFNFTTLCDPVSAWSDDLEAYASGTTSLPNCWRRVSVNGSYYVTTTTPSSGVRSFYMFRSSTGPLVGTVVPVNNLGSGTHQLRFFGRSGATTYNPLLELGYVTNVNDENTFTALASVTLVGTAMAEYTVAVPAGSVPAGAQFALRANTLTVGTSTSWTIYLDDLNWEAVPTCPWVSGVSVQPTGPTAISASWTPGGSETQWEVAVVPAGDPAPSSGTMVSSTSYTFTGLTLGSAYTAYIRAVCGPGDSSQWRSGSTTITYCASNATSTDDSKLGSVTIGDTTIVSPVGLGNCATYTDLTGTTIANITYGLPVNLGATYGTCDGNFSSYTKIYIDLNNDLVFDEVNELFAEGSTSTSSTSTPLSVVAQMPPVAQHLGLTRLRVVLRESGSTTTTLACGTYTYGETQDYTVNLLPPPNCLPPSNIGVASVYGNQATIRWTGNGSIAYQVQYGAVGFAIGSGTIVGTAQNSGDTSRLITGLTPSTSYHYYVRSRCGSNLFSPWAGPFNLNTTVSCPAPSNFTVAIGSTSANVSWQSNGLSNNVNYIVGPSASTTTSNGTILSATGTTLNLTGLADNTPHVLFVRDSCGPGDVSAWVTVNFTTLCLPFSAPYTQGFESLTVTSSTQNLNPICWTVSPVSTSTSSLGWRVEDGTTSSGTTGPQVDNTLGTSSGKYMYMETSSGVAGSQAALFSPIINLSGLDANRQVSFYYHMYGATMGTMMLLVTDVNGTDTLWSITGQQQTLRAAPWVLVEQDISAYSGEVLFTFLGIRGSSFNSDMAIDDFRIDNAPACANPSGLTANVLNSNSANLYWEEGSASSTQWVVEYGLNGFTQGAGTIVGANDTTLTLTGLMANTAYQFYVAEVCPGGADTSWFIGPVTFTTTMAVPYYYDFAAANSTNPGAGWIESRGVLGGSNTTFSSTTASNWIEDGMGNVGTTDAYRINISTSSTAIQEWIISPSLDFGAGGNYELRWQSALTASGSSTTVGNLSADDSIIVVVSYDNGITWNRSGRIGSVTQANQPGLTPQFYTLPVNSLSGVVKFGFYARSTATSTQSVDFFVDNFEIRPVPTCPDIAFGSLAVTNVAGTSATVSFASGVGPQYEVEYGPVGYTAGTGTSVVGTDTMVTLTGLTAFTSYEVRVRQVCAGNDAGAWSFPVSFQTAIVPAWSEDFSGTTVPPAGWSRASGLIGSTLGTSTSWLADGWLNNGTTGAIKRNLFSSNNHHWLITPSIELPVGVYNHKLDFDMAIMDFGATIKGDLDADDTVFVLLSTDNGATWNRSNILYFIEIGNKPDTTEWHVSLDLASYAGNTVKIAWLASTRASGSDVDVMVDNVEIDIDCSENYNATANITGDYRVQFNWTTQPGVGTYRISWRPAGSNGSWNSAVSSTSSKVVLNRAPGDYEFYISEQSGANPSCLGYFTVQCATGITFQYNVFQAPEMNQFGFVTVFGINGGKSLYDITLEYPDGTRELRENRNNFSFRSLAAGNYTIEVADDFGCAADNVGNFTIDALDTNYVPFLISAVNSSPNGYRPLWNRPRRNGAVPPGIINYQVRVQNVTDGTLVGLFTGITDTFRVVNNLTPGKTYRFNVRSRYNPGSGARNSAYSIGRNRNLGAGGNKEENGSDGVIALNDHMTVYPNPVAEMLYVNSSRSAEITLMDIAGNAIAGYKLMADQELGINMGTLAAGVYMLRVVDGDKVYNQRIIKK